MIDKIWNWLVPPEGVKCDTQNQGYLVVCDGNMALLVPIDPKGGSSCTEDLFACPQGCPPGDSDVATSFSG